MKLAKRQVLNYIPYNPDLSRTIGNLCPVIGRGVKEIRIHVLGEWRIIYVTKFEDAVYVLHSFQKKSKRTNQNDIESARKRFKQIGG